MGTYQNFQELLISLLTLGYNVEFSDYVGSLQIKLTKVINNSDIDEFSINTSENALVYRIDGYLFQMISWIALKLQHINDDFYHNTCF